VHDGTPHELFRSIGRVVQNAIERHEDEMHIPPPKRGRLRAIPFPTTELSDVQVSRAVEMLQSGSSLHEAAEVVGAPAAALERALAEFRPRWRNFLQERESSG
jgi:hypothetical protein